MDAGRYVDRARGGARVDLEGGVERAARRLPRFRARRARQDSCGRHRDQGDERRLADLGRGGLFARQPVGALPARRAHVYDRRRHRAGAAHAGRLLHSRPRAAADTGRLPDGRPRPAGYASRQAIGTVARQTSHLKRSPGWKDLRVEDFALKHLAPKHLARLNTWRLNTWGLKTWRLKTWRLSAWHSRSWGLRNASLDRGARARRGTMPWQPTFPAPMKSAPKRR